MADADRPASPISAQIDALIERLRPDAKSLIVSLYGDAVAPHGGAIWLGSLIDLVEPLGLGDRVVRTSVFRLAKEGWLTSTQVGRRSAYGLTESGRRRFEAADRVIYAAARQPWSGRWTIAFTGLVEAEAREALRADLAWQGFGQLLPGVMVHPEPDDAALRQALGEAVADDRAVVMRASGDDWDTRPEALRDLVARAWDLVALAAGYNAFLADFRPFLAALERAPAPPREAFRLRILLVHAWRRAILRDPLLPEELLPADWPGAAARLLVRNLYRATRPAEIHLARTMVTPDGPIGPPNAGYFERFGGLAGEIARPPVAIVAAT